MATKTLEKFKPAAQLVVQVCLSVWQVLFGPDGALMHNMVIAPRTSSGKPAANHTVSDFERDVRKWVAARRKSNNQLENLGGELNLKVDPYPASHIEYRVVQGESGDDGIHIEVFNASLGDLAVLEKDLNPRVVRRGQEMREWPERGQETARDVDMRYNGPFGP